MSMHSSGGLLTKCCQFNLFRFKKKETFQTEMESNPVVAEAIKVLSAKISSLKTELNALTNQRENQVIL